MDINLSYTPPAPRLTLHAPHPSSSSLSSASNGSSSTRATTPVSISDLLAGLLFDTESTAGSAASHAPLKVTLDVHMNGELVVSEQNVTEGRRAGEEDLDKAQEVEKGIKRLGRALDVVGDLGVWGEWLRREVGREG